MPTSGRRYAWGKRCVTGFPVRDLKSSRVPVTCRILRGPASSTKLCGTVADRCRHDEPEISTVQKAGWHVNALPRNTTHRLPVRKSRIDDVRRTGRWDCYRGD